MSIATRSGDDGNTRLFGGRRVAKDDDRIEAHGAIDELNAYLGMVRVSPIPVEIDVIIRRIQSDLLDLANELLIPRENNPDAKGAPPFPPSALDAVDTALNELEAEVPPMTAHLLPGGHHGAALLSVCRALCRRAERRTVSLARHERISGVVLRYLNRLSDLLFVMARFVNTTNGMPEPEWEPRELREAEDE